MLNRKVIVGIAVIVLSFVGIFTFALNNNNSNDKPKDQDVNNVDDDQNDNQNNNQNNDQTNDEESEAVIPTRVVAEDTTDPVISNVQLSTTEWTKGSVMVTVFATDNVGVTGYSFNGSEWQTNNITSISTNGSVEIRVRDEAGNIATVNQLISNIDITAPTVVFETNGNSTYAKIASTKITVTFEGAPIDSASLKYVWTTSTTAPENSAFDGGNITLDENHASTIDTSNITPAPTGIYYLWILAKDEAGNGEPVRSEAFYLDNEKPVIASVGKNTESITKENVTLTVNASDNTSLSNKLKYSFDNGTTWQDENTKVFSQNGTVKILVKDEAGNISELTTVEVSNIDKVAPQTIVEVPEEGKFVKGTEVKVKVTSTDNMGLSIIVANLYSSNGTLLKDSNKSVTGTSAIHEYDFSSLNLADGKYYIKANARDKAGTISNTVTRNFIVDSTKPTIKVNLNRLSYLTSGTPVSKTAIPEFEGYDENLLKVVIYKENGTVQNEATATTSSRRAKVTHLTDGKYTIIAYDKAGNESEPFILIMDSTAPTITSVTGNATEWTKQDVTLTVNASDNTSLSNKLKYSFDNGTTWQAENTKVFSQNGTVKILVKDEAGNISALTTVEINKIDKVAPETVVEVPEEGRFIKGTEVKVKVTSTDNMELAQIVANLYSSNGTLLKDSNKSVTGTSAIHEYDFSSLNLADGKYYIKANALDKAGTISNTVTRNFVVDSTKPTLKVNLNRLSYLASGTPVSKTAIPEFEGYDENLLKVVIYRENGTVQNEATATTSSRRANVTHLADGKYTIIAYDKAGNESEPFVLIMDSTAPTVPTFNLNGYNEDWTKENIFISLSSSDAYSGVLTNQMRYNDEATWHDVGNGVTFANTYNMTVQFRSVDKAGNVSEPTRKIVIKQDQTLPTVPTFNLNGYNGDWTKENIFISLSSSDAHSGLLTNQMRYNDEATWYDVGNGVTFANTYNMTVQFRSVDKAGNVSEPTRKIVIKQDNDIPSIPTVDFNGYVPGTWTNQTVNVTLNSTDGGSGIDKYQDKHIDFDWWYSDIVDNVFSVTDSSTQTWAFRAVDKVGHTSAATASYQILVDKINPYVQYTNDSNHATYMSNHTVNVLVAGGNGQSPLDLSNTKYLWSKDASGIDSDDFATNGQTFPITNNYANVSGNTSMDGIYYLWIMTKDTAGNLTIASSAAYYFDNMDPTISIDGKASIEIELGSNFNLMTDIVANDSSNQFNVTHSAVDLSTIGIKTVVYTVTDSVGRTASATRTINVVDTTDPQAHFGNLVYNASYTRIGHLFKNATATYEVNIIDYGNLAVLKYVWMPAGLKQGETLWNAAWLLSKDFNNNAQISQDFGALTYSSKWKLWIYAKDASGNDIFASTDEIEIK